MHGCSHTNISGLVGWLLAAMVSSCSSAPSSCVNFSSCAFLLEMLCFCFVYHDGVAAKWGIQV